jgi:beta-glucanase (GH16 family)
MHKTIPFLVAALLSSVSAPAAGPPGEGWELVFHDEFNGKQLNWNTWTCEKGDRRNAFNDPDDSYLDGHGHLILRVRKAGDGKYHLGFIRTTREFQWGYYEARATLDTVPGYWSAFWLWGKQSYNPDHSGAEVDIMEDPHRGDTVEHNIHQGQGETRKHEGAPGRIKGPREDWHLLGVDWSEQGFDFFVDGEKTWATRTMTADKANWIYLTEEAQFQGWTADIRQYDGSLPAYWTVDYVRYYQPNPQAAFVTLSQPKPIRAGRENGAVVNVTIRNGKFAARMHGPNWSVENLPPGVRLGSVKRVDDTHVVLKLKGHSALGAVKADIPDLTVIAEAGEVANSSALLIANSGLTLTAK